MSFICVIKYFRNYMHCRNAAGLKKLKESFNMEIRNSLLFIIILFTQIIGITTGIVFYARNILYTGELQWLEHRSESVYFITNTRLFKYIENFTTKEKKEFSDKKNLIFFLFLLKT